MSNKYKEITEELLGLAGVKVNGPNPWDIQVHNEKFYKKALTEGELGLGESYMDGWWDIGKLDELVCKIQDAQLKQKIKLKFSIMLRMGASFLADLPSRRRAFVIGERHYDMGNDLFQSMLDKRLNYSCAYWNEAADLDEAQEKKLDLICRKLDLQPGMRVLDIGCGWGAFGKYAAEKYDVEVVGITVSREQVAMGRELCQGLPVEFRLADYRDVHEKFDRIVSVGMIEHVGYRNYKTYFRAAHECLKKDGLMLLHTIGFFKSVKSTDLWTKKYIFPVGMIPSAAQLSKAWENLFFVQDWHNFGVYYDKTLMAWHDNFVKNWHLLQGKYSERFYRMWIFYLLSAAGSFRSGNQNQLWQIVLSKNGLQREYQAVR
ncbi:MAG: cyclopropane fatty acyl phospholipid synthase [Bacteroidota bacterium]|nr:cyclopropane fatty acyl phospholipid synthase [Bacteroidota bacterium]